MEQLVPLLVLLLIWGGYKLYQHRHTEAINEHVAWCAEKDISDRRCNLTLLEHVRNFQIRQKLDPKYRISAEEWDSANLILAAYQQELADDFFAGRAYRHDRPTRITSEDYFMLTLQHFLGKHETDLRLCDHPKYILRDMKTYGSWGGQLYDADYALTDFGIVYHKLFFTTLVYFKAAPDSWLLKGQKEILDTGRIQLSRI